MANHHARKFWVLDSETDPFKYQRIPKPFIWGVYTGEDYFEFETAGQMIDFLRDKDIVIYAHNGGGFDYHFIKDYFEPGEMLVINGRLSKFKIGLCEFRDSYNIIPTSLDKFYKTKIDYSKFESHCREKYMGEIRRYLKSDCINLYEMVKRFREDYGIYITQASAAMSIWSKMSGRSSPKSSATFYDEIHPYYYGGRVQCFEAGDFTGKFQSYDINSAYPYAMLHEHPIAIDGGQCMGLPKNMAMGPCFFEVTCLSEGAFPYRAKDNSLYFPDWRVEGAVLRKYFVSGWELKAAIDTNTIKNITIGLCHYFNEVTHFKMYVDRFWEQKFIAKETIKLHPRNMDAKAKLNSSKLFLTSLYGKFGANPRTYEKSVFHLNSEEDYREPLLTGVSVDNYGKGFFTYHPSEDPNMRFYNLATAASITGFVRAHLWRHILKANGPVYCDTDSITARSFSGFDLGSGIGQWEKEGEYDRIVIGGKKLYAMHHAGEDQQDKHWKKASKGVKITAKQIIQIAAGDTVTYYPIAPTFSIKRTEPIFTPRQVRITARDIRKIPEKIDPLLNPAEIAA